ncbi:hypothetical protein [Nocardia sp. NRRL S-836]|uniref:hypothetical protein n=1 Tax=Nocardia sp. NRRL S-836 TaxID=1519492 RepID=UPI0006B000C8|nr:hypothetical protein [Nocardia sp. NRRL S-836]KOV84779.1 hypothetical protein ADL03_16070 [Nocardia sp. NRRL S-836]
MTPPQPIATPRIADDTIVNAIRMLIDEYWEKDKADYEELRGEAEHQGAGEANPGYHPFDALRDLKAWLDGPQPDACTNGTIGGLCGDERCQHCVSLALAADAELHSTDHHDHPDTALTLADPLDRKQDTTQ